MAWTKPKRVAAKPSTGLTNIVSDLAVPPEPQGGLAIHGAAHPCILWRAAHPQLDLTLFFLFVRQIEHLWDIGEVCAKYNVSIDQNVPHRSSGLDAEEVEKRAAEHGKNEIPPARRTPAALVFLKVLFGLFNLMLILAGILSLSFAFISEDDRTQNLFSGIMLMVVVLINTAIEFYENRKGESVIKSFSKVTAVRCSVLRGQAEKEILAADLVPGDVVHLRLGGRSPADIVLFSCTDLRVENSSLTGESFPVEKSCHETATDPLESPNVVFSGSLVVGGEGYGVAVRTGPNAAIANIVSIADSAKRTVSPLVRELNSLVKLTALIAIVIAVAFVPYLAYNDQKFSAIALFVVGIFISIVPQGLPVCVPIVLESAHKRLSKTNVLVKDLYSIETLGSVTMVATDKTGTITRNQMTASIIWAGEHYFCTAAAVIDSLGLDSASLVNLDDPRVRTIIEASILCSRAEVSSDSKDAEITGDATDSGLMRNAIKFIPSPGALRAACPKQFEIPFNSDLKYCITIHNKPHPGGIFTLLMKGAPERVFGKCKYVVADNGDRRPIDQDTENSFYHAYHNIASKGHRVIAFAGLHLDSKSYPEDYVFSRYPRNFPDADLDFYGLVSLEDPPKKGVREAIGLCRRGGLKVIMITGDHPATAEAIARRVNISTYHSSIVVNDMEGMKDLMDTDGPKHSVTIAGSVLPSLTDDEWIKILSMDEIIFARTSPGHKLEIIKWAQKCGHVVGVTGDGVNDAPALKRADVGISMNFSASEVPREAAKIILLDDNFATLVTGIVEGRRIFKKLRRAVRYTLSHVFGEVAPLLLSVLVPLPHPLGSLLVLFFDLCFELFVSISYVWEYKEESKEALMRQTPRISVPRSPEALKCICLSKDTLKSRIKIPFRSGGKAPSYKVQKRSLADIQLLSWSYAFAGIVEACGCAAAYFLAAYTAHGVKPSDLANLTDAWGKRGTLTLSSGEQISMQDQIKVEGAGRLTWFYGLCLQQLCNYLACIIIDQKRLSPSVLIPNRRSTLLILASIGLSLLLLIPQVNFYFQGDSGIEFYVMFVPLVFGIFLNAAAVLKVVCCSRFRHIFPSKVSNDDTFHELKLASTVYTTQEPM